ncbi:MAG: restriction endonuclease subunit S [Patescibacteria group bacterium]|jgi:type I restriction enzyme S subunit|nr:restriction endonuclease subunit S [bacterium]HQC49565.1 restriction endonuclease subunit S [bacterium]
MTNQTNTIPKGWKMTTLGEVFHVKHGYAFSGEGITNKENRNILLTPGNFFVGGGWKDGKKFFIGEIPADYLLKNDDLVITMTDLSKDGDTLGFPALVPSNQNKNYLHNQRIGLVNINENLNSKKFIYFFLRTTNYQRYIVNTASGSTVRHTSPAKIESYKTILPPLPEQRAIAAVLSSFDDKIELLREQNKILETTAQTIFKEWFVKFNFPGATEKMIDSELGKIPEGWRVGGLIEDGISEFVKTNIDEFEGVKDYIETANVNLSSLVGSFEKITYFKRPSRANMQPVPNSFWFARMAESRKYLLFQEKDKQDIETKILSTGFAGIKCIKEYLYFYWCFILSDMFNNLKNQYADGAVQVAISNDGIKKIMFVLPPKNLAEKFTKTVEACFEKISNNISQIQTLSNLRDTLLPKLMEGEVRVKGFNN